MAKATTPPIAEMIDNQVKTVTKLLCNCSVGSSFSWKEGSSVMLVSARGFRPGTSGTVTQLVNNNIMKVIVRNIRYS